MCLFAIAAIAPATLAQWTVTNLHPTGALHSRALGTGSGEQAGYAQLGPTVGHIRASLWNSTALSWTNLHPVGTVYSIAFGADSAQQVGEVFPTGLPHAALWTGTVASWVDLNPPPTDGYVHSSEAFAVRAGKQVGYLIAVGGVNSAALWSGSAATLVNLHPPGAYSSWAHGVSDGQQVGRVQLVPGGAQNACLWTGSASSFVNLHPAVADNSQALAVRAGRQVGSVIFGGVRRASLWTGTAASWVNLSSFLPASFSHAEATGISIDGGQIRIVGYGFNTSTFRDEAILWTMAVPPPPCPADINGDHSVNTSDLTLLLSRFGQSVPSGTQGDLNGDGTVNTADLVLLLNAFGSACP